MQSLGDLSRRPLGPLQVGEEACVVKRQGHPAGEHLRELGIFAAIAPPRPGGDQSNSAGQLAARPQRDGDRRTDVEAAQKLEVIGIARQASQILF